MLKIHYTALLLMFCALLAAILAAGCSVVTASPTATPTIQKTTAPTATSDLPVISAAVPDQSELPDYQSLTLSVVLKAKYSNPYDLRQVSLDGVFSGPDGKQMKVPGFWDGDSSWQVRFTPSQVGAWKYQLTVTDGRGTSQPYPGTFTVTASNLHGWLQAGNWVNPAYSGHYLVYQDSTPFYGIGFDNALNILADGFNIEQGLGVFSKMKAAGQNYVVWWPLYSNSPISGSYDDYSAPSMKIIDLIVADAQKKGIFLVFTIWDHPELRDSTHAWGNGNWDKNGFHLLDENINTFFTSQEAWAWQENFYRYIIARWGYSPAIGMWQTVSEINGTNAYTQTDPWHKQMNDYFVANDPYRHPTTASMSGDLFWSLGYPVMDAPQMHVYNFTNGPMNTDAVYAAEHMAQLTSQLWDTGDKPNWVGEFGDQKTTYSTFPELFHNSIWAALASGAAMEPAAWNFKNNYADLMPYISADTARLGQFVSGLPLAQWNPAPLQISSSDPQVRGWGVAGKAGGLFWVQDFSLEGQSIDVVRASQTVRKGVQLQIQGLAGGNYTITPYDTWQGTFLAATSVTCADVQPCTVALPDFKADMAFKIERK